MSTAIAVTVFVVAYLFIATEKIPKMAAALGGAGVVLALGVSGSEDAFYSEDTGVDWNVIFLLLGMMIIVGILRRTGVFEYVAIWAAKRAKGSPLRVMILLCLITAVASAFLDNVTTVLLIAPVTLLVCDRLDIKPVPFLIAEVLASNIGGAATLIGDPPNIIIGSRAGLAFNDFLVNMAPIVAIELVVFTLVLPRLFRGSFTVDPARVADVMALNEREAIQKPKLLIKCGVVLLAVFAGFVLHSVIHIEPSIVALLGAGILVLISGTEPKQYLAGVEWETLLFFAGLFIMIGALVKTGVIGDARPARRRRHRRQRPARRDAHPRGIGGAVRRHRQHPLRRDHEPARFGSDQRHLGPLPFRGTVVVAGDRRRLRRQHDRRRRQRQRRHARYRRPRPVHPSRSGNSRRRAQSSP